MPHGDFSDIAGLFLVLTGVQQIFYPELLFATYGPLKPYFDAPTTGISAEMVHLLIIGLLGHLVVG